MKSVTKSMPWLLGFAFCALQTSGQSYYPAGLGNSNLILWLTTSDPTTVLNAANGQAANGSAIKTWKDKSGSGSNATQNTNANRPVFETNQLNGFGGVIFQNDNQYLAGATGAYQTIIAVRSMPGTGHYQYLFSSPSNADFSIRGGGAGTNYADGPPPNGNDWSYNTGATPTQWINGVQSLAGSSTNHILVSSAARPTNATYSISNYNPTAGWGGRGMNGNDPVYELLGYDNTPNNTERILLENYEGAEWGLTSLLPTSGYTTYTPPSVSTFNQNLVGIGYTSAMDDFLTNPSGSTDGLGFSSGTGATAFLYTAGYIMAAHNGQSNTIINNASIPGITSVTNIRLWNRSWNVQQYGGNSTGLVTMNFNFSDYNGSTPVAAYTYYVLYNATDGTFMSGTNELIPVVSSGVSGKIVSLGVNAANLPAGYYTLIYSNTPIILPITLTRFTAEKQSSASLLDWSVSGQTGSNGSSGISGISRFEVDRSTDATHFDSIGSVEAESGIGLGGGVGSGSGIGSGAGAGSGSGSDSYALTDNHPAAGMNYYRLKMMDASGAFSYSYIVEVDFGNAASVPLVYPNPVTDVLHVNLNSNFPAEISLFNIRGALVTSQNGAASVEIPVNNLARGIYWLEINAGGVKSIQKIIKE